MAWPSETAVLDLAKPLVKRWEGLRLKPYLCPTGHATIGWGSTHYPDGRLVTMQDEPIDQSFAEVCLTAHMNKDADRLGKLLTHMPTNHQAAAILSLAYNIGVGIHDGVKGDLADSSLLDAFNANDIQRAADHFLDWDKGHIDGKLVTINGLLLRRRDERTLFLTPDAVPVPTEKPMGIA